MRVGESCMAGLALEKAEDVFSLCSLLATGKGLIVQRERAEEEKARAFMCQLSQCKVFKPTAVHAHLCWLSLDVY